MMRLLINGLAATAGGGPTYLRNVIPRFATRTDVQIAVALPPSLRREFRDLPNVSFLGLTPSENPAERFWQEQTVLPRLIGQVGADVLISAGNFALRVSPVPQILLSRNALYTSADFFRDLRRRHEYTMWLESRARSVLARRSIFWADCTVAPSEAFAKELRQWTGREVIAIHHGFDHGVFFQDHTSPPAEVSRQLEADGDTLRLLLVSHYNYYRNFETLLCAIPLIREQLKARKVKLFLTCSLKAKENPGSYRAETAAKLIARLGIAENVVGLGTVPYGTLHHVYRACDMYVAPAYAESFAHPLVEAMSSGLPVVASDLPVHREICADAALYFPPFSPQELARQILRIAHSKGLAASLSQEGLRTAGRFSWSGHVDQIVSLAARLKRSGSSKQLVGKMGADRYLSHSAVT